MRKNVLRRLGVADCYYLIRKVCSSVMSSLNFSSVLPT